MLFILYIQKYICTLSFAYLCIGLYVCKILTYIMFVCCTSPLSITVHILRYNIIYAVVLTFSHTSLPTTISSNNAISALLVRC